MGVEQVDVAVVGAGLAGLVAARRLVQSGASVRVLEARDRVGGRTYDRVLADGTRVELGGQWIGPTQDRVAALADEVGVATFPTYNMGENLLDLGGRQQRYRGAIPRINPLVLADIGQAQARIDRLARSVPLDAPWLGARAEGLDAQTVETWIRRNVRSRPARDLLRLGVQAVFAAEASDISLLHLLFYVHSGTSFDTLLAVAGGAQEQRFVEGPQELSVRVAADLGEAVWLDAPVGLISQTAEGVVVSTARGDVTARFAVVAVPPTLAGRIRYDPLLPAARDQLTQRMPMGSVIKVHVRYDEPFWRADGLTGQATSDRGAVRVTFDNSPLDGSSGVLLGFIEGDEARRWSAEPADDRHRVVIADLVRYFGRRAGEYAELVELDWSTEEWTRGCYGAHLAPGVWTAYGPALRTPCGRIHWAGTETSTVWSGYLDGAVRSGERVAADVAGLLG